MKSVWIILKGFKTSVKKEKEVARMSQNMKSLKEQMKGLAEKKGQSLFRI